jgi:hypothetical protein
VTRKAKKAKRPIGRPPIQITDDQLEQIERLSGYGLTEAQIAAVLSMHPNTLRAKKHAERVSVALEAGKAKAQGIVGQALFTRAKGGDISAIRWWEMTRAGRTEASRTEHTGAGGKDLPVSIPFYVVDPKPPKP